MTDRETVVVKDGGGSGAGMILGILAIYRGHRCDLVLRTGTRDRNGDERVNVNVELPSVRPNAS